MNYVSHFQGQLDLLLTDLYTPDSKQEIYCKSHWITSKKNMKKRQYLERESVYSILSPMKPDYMVQRCYQNVESVFPGGLADRSMTIDNIRSRECGAHGAGWTEFINRISITASINYRNSDRVVIIIHSAASISVFMTARAPNAPAICIQPIANIPTQRTLNFTN